MDMVTHISRYQYANTYIIYVLTVEIDGARPPTHLAHDDHIYRRASVLRPKRVVQNGSTEIYRWEHIC